MLPNTCIQHRVALKRNQFRYWLSRRPPPSLIMQHMGGPDACLSTHHQALVATVPSTSPQRHTTAQLQTAGARASQLPAGVAATTAAEKVPRLAPAAGGSHAMHHEGYIMAAGLSHLLMPRLDVRRPPQLQPHAKHHGGHDCHTTPTGLSHLFIGVSDVRRGRPGVEAVCRQGCAHNAALGSLLHASQRLPVAPAAAARGSRHAVKAVIDPCMMRPAHDAQSGGAAMPVQAVTK